MVRKKQLLVLSLVFALLSSSSISLVKPASATDMANTWSIKASMPQSEQGIRAVAVNGLIYVIGSSFNFEYNPKTDEYTTKTSMPTPRAYFAVGVYQNKIYTIGGSSGQDYFSSNEAYDPSTDTWDIHSPMPVNISGVDANVVNGKIYVIGGGSYQNPSLSINLVYDVANDVWMNKTLMPYPAVHYASSVVDNKIYMMSGKSYLQIDEQNILKPFNQTQIYDPETDSWSLGAPIPVPVSSASAGATIGVMAPKRVYVIGGTTMEGGAFAGGTSLTQVYDPKGDSWVVGESMPSSRFGLAVAVLDDQIYAFGGQNQIIFAPPAFRVNQRYTPFGYGTPDSTYDGVSPEITLDSPKNITYYSSSVNLQFMLNERVYWMGYSLDNEAVVDVSGNTTLFGLSLGSHSLIAYAIDMAENSGFSETIFFNVAEFSVGTVIGAFVLVAVVVGVGLLVYFKKSKRKTANLTK